MLVVGVLRLGAVLAASCANGSPATGDASFDLVPAGAVVDTTELRPTTKTRLVAVMNRKTAATFTAQVECEKIRIALRAKSTT